MTHIETVRRELMSKIAKSKSDSRTNKLLNELKRLKTVEKRSYNAAFDRVAKKTCK